MRDAEEKFCDDVRSLAQAMYAVSISTAAGTPAAVLAAAQALRRFMVDTLRRDGAPESVVSGCIELGEHLGSVAYAGTRIVLEPLPKAEG